MASYADAVAAIKARLAAGWSTTPIVHENEDASAYAGVEGQPVPFVLLEIESDAAEQRSIGSPGSNWFQDSGAIRVTCFVPSGTGTDLALTYAGTIGELFRNAQIELGPGSCVRSWAPQVGRGGPAASENPEGRWYAVAVTTPFEFLRLA
jgi:hypothetical protein